MNILLITSTFPTSSDDSQVGWLGDMVRNIRDAGHSVDIFAPSYGGIPQADFLGIPVFRFRYAPARWEILTHGEGAVFKLREKPWLLLFVFLYMAGGLFGIVRKTWRSRYDLIHVQWPFPQGVFGVVAKFFSHGRLLFSVYGAEFTLAKRIPAGNSLFATLLGFADRITAISTFTKKQIQDLRPVSVDIIPFGATVQSVNVSSHREPIREKNNKRVLFVGRLIDRKGVEYLIRAISMVQKKKRVQLDIVGNGSLYTHLFSLVKDLHIDDSVRFYRQISRKQLAALYDACDVFVLPSIADRWGDTEGLGVVLIEALLFRKPVIASRVGGIIDIIKHEKTGLLVPEKNSAALADAIVRVLADQKGSRLMGERGYRYVSAAYDWNRIMKKLLKMYEEEAWRGKISNCP